MKRQSFEVREFSVISFFLNAFANHNHNHLREINNGIHIYQFSFELFNTLLFPDVVVVSDKSPLMAPVSDLNKNIADRRIWRKQGTVGGFGYIVPLFTPA